MGALEPEDDPADEAPGETWEELLEQLQADGELPPDEPTVVELLDAYADGASWPSRS